MTGRHRVRTVTAALRDVPGVQLVQADLTTSTVTLHGEPAVTDVLAALDRARFPGTVLPALPTEPDTGGTPGREAADGSAPG
jgi:copper chaperone CopZ